MHLGSMHAETMLGVEGCLADVAVMSGLQGCLGGDRKSLGLLQKAV